MDSHRGGKLSRIGEVLVSTLQSDSEMRPTPSELVNMPNTESNSPVEQPALNLWHETDFDSAFMVLSEQDLIDGSAFPLGARIASRRRSQGHREAEMLPTPAPPSAMDSQVTTDGASSPAGPARSTHAMQPGPPCSSMPQPGRSARSQTIAGPQLRDRSHTAAMSSDN